MTFETPGDKTAPFKAAMVLAAELSMRPLEDPDHALLIRYGFPSSAQLNEFDDIVSVGDTTTTVETGPMSRTKRAETDTIAITVQVSVWRPGVQPYADLDADPVDYTDGGDDLEKEASDQAYRLVSALREQVRVVDTTLGELMYGCRLTSHQAVSAKDPAVLARGREIQIDAVFTATTRVSS